MAPEPDVDEAPVPDLLGSILSGQSLLMMDSADITIHRDGSLSAKRAGKPPPSGSGDTAWMARVGRGCVSHAQKTRRRVGVFSPLVLNSVYGQITWVVTELQARGRPAGCESLPLIWVWQVLGAVQCGVWAASLPPAAEGLSLAWARPDSKYHEGTWKRSSTASLQLPRVPGGPYAPRRAVPSHQQQVGGT